MESKKKLPYCETNDCFLIYISCKISNSLSRMMLISNKSKYMSFPDGGAIKGNVWKKLEQN